MKKTLYFEGAGCVPCNDVENCRIRTAFNNKDGRKIYIEFTSGCKNTFDGKKYVSEDGYMFCDYCHYITDDAVIDDCNCSVLPCERAQGTNPKRYTKENILAFVNKHCNADFDEIVVLNNLAGFRVFAEGKKNTFSAYNYGDEFIYDKELTERRIAKVNELKEKFCALFGQRYDNTSYFIRNGQLVVRLNVEEKKRIEAGYKEREFIVEV